MAREGRKLELYEILAAKRAKGKNPLGMDQRAAEQEGAGAENKPAPSAPPEATLDGPGLIVDDAVAAEVQLRPDTQPRPDSQRLDTQRLDTQRPDSQFGGYEPPPSFPQPPQQPPPPERKGTRAFTRRDRKTQQATQVTEAVEAPPPAKPPRPRTPREVVFALDTAFMFFVVTLALVGCAYFLGYKRGQEERPTGMDVVAGMDTADPDRINIRSLAPAPRAVVRPSEADWTLVLRTEPASDDLPERLELELSEAIVRGRQEAGVDVPGFIFRTADSNPLHIIAVGLGSAANDAALGELFKIYNRMEGMTFSRTPRPYIGCSVAPVRELGTAVY